MDHQKRLLLKSLCLIPAGIITPSIFYGEDYSIKKNPDQNKYIYNPFASSPRQEVQESEIITNNILPEQSNNFWDLPRKIYLYRKETKENAQIVYFNNGRINEKGYALACHLLRDVKENVVHNIDLKLLDLICAVQAWLRYYGINNPIMIHSGFRTKKTNSRLESASKNSMHLVGKAIDFSVVGLSPIQLAQLAAHFKAGGIGIYPNPRDNFIHLDTGGVRVWVKK